LPVAFSSEVETVRVNKTRSSKDKASVSDVDTGSREKARL
jgi:hypothetical protein